eukprot:7591635-Ditylum_brightwellii.AAC.1
MTLRRAAEPEFFCLVMYHPNNKLEPHDPTDVSGHFIYGNLCQATSWQLILISKYHWMGWDFGGFS